MSHLGLPLSAADIETKVQTLLKKLVLRKIKKDNGGLNAIPYQYFWGNEFQALIKEYTELIIIFFKIDTTDRHQLKNFEYTVFKQFIKQVGMTLKKNKKIRIKVDGKYKEISNYSII